jgi:hypothetical protein
MSVSIFQLMLSQFAKVGHADSAKLSQHEVGQALNLLARKNTSMDSFDPDIAEQLWEHSNKTPEGMILVKDYVQTLIDARNILNENVVKCQSKRSVI